MDPSPAVPWATPIGVALLLSAVALAVGDPRPPRWQGPLQVRLRDAAGAAVVGDVAARCWHAHLDPAFTEASGPTDATGAFTMAAPDCLALELAAVSPGHTPVVDRMGELDDPIDVALTPLPTGPEPEVRETGWRGRTTPGARLEATEGPDGVIRVVGWDLQGDRPALRREDADLWLEADKGDGISTMKVVAAADHGVGARPFPLQVTKRAPFPWDAPRWQPDPDEGDDAPPKRLTALITRDGQTRARVDFPQDPGPDCTSARCPSRSWTSSVVIYPEDASWRLPTPQRAADLLSPPAPGGVQAAPQLAHLLDGR